MNCPKCQSANVQKVSVIWESGTVQTQSTTTGIGYGSGIGIGTAYSSGKNQSLFAKRFAPPREPSLGVMAGAGVFIVGLVLGSLIACVFWNISVLVAFTIIPTTAFGLTIAAMGYVVSKGWKKYQSDTAQWNNTWACNACGSTFIP